MICWSKAKTDNDNNTAIPASPYTNVAFRVGTTRCQGLGMFTSVAVRLPLQQTNEMRSPGINGEFYTALCYVRHQLHNPHVSELTQRIHVVLTDTCEPC